MKTSIATVSISGELPEKLAAIARAGFDGVEIFENDFLAFDGSPADVGRMVRDFGLEITLFQPFRDFEGMPEPHRSRTFDRAERKFDIMQQLGTDLVLVCSNVSPVSLGGIDRAAADFHELGERAAKRGLKVGYEALAWGRHISDHRDAWEIVRRADHPNIGLILDSFHTLSRKIDIKSIRSIPKDKIFIVQLADAPLIDMDLLYWSRHFRNMPGEGDLAVTDFTAAIAATGYDGYFSLEIFNDQFRGGSPKAIAVDGHRSLIWLGDQVRRRPDSQGLTVTPMPDRAVVKGVAFVEFAADEADAESLIGILRILGFAKDRGPSQQEGRGLQPERHPHTGQYREFRLCQCLLCRAWHLCLCRCADGGGCQGGTRACGRAWGRAFRAGTGTGELELPAIRGVGGGLIYLLDEASDLGRFSEIDFRPVEDEVVVQTTHLRHVDHVAQTVGYEEMLTWLLFYTSLFATHKTPMVDIIDPAGWCAARWWKMPRARFGSRSTVRKTAAPWRAISWPKNSAPGSSISPFTPMTSSPRRKR